ncbi:MAG: Ppx/GppA family phosphatase [Deltaproteobacteria bacterium]|nr:MAG: Ppx/GppA family phosphatase [Deltaproteobacteria bacterium]
MKVAAIDIGTNSVHLLIAAIGADGRIEVVEKAREQVELGSGGLDAHRLTPEAIDRGVSALESFKAACDGHEVEDIYATATSAVREASNGVDFCKQVKERTGIHVRVITGAEEARLIHLGARRDLDFSSGRVLVFDLGGGSTEFILCDPEDALVRMSLRIGHIRLSDRFHDQDPLGDAAYREIKKAVAAQLSPLLQRVQPGDFQSLVGTSGAVRTLAKMATLRRGDKEPEHEHGLVLLRSELDELVRMLRSQPQAEYLEIPGMDPKRQHTLPAGAIIVREIMRAFEIDRLVTSERGLRDGLIVDWVLRHRPEISLTATTPDPRRRAVLSVMRHYRADPDHANFVARAARQLFDVTAPLHGLRIDDRRTLEFAAQLHDIGHHIAGKDHQKHGMYLIRHTRMPGFTAPEIELMAQLVRYHRGGGPKRAHANFKILKPREQYRVRVLAGILQLADALDRGHDQNTTRLDTRLEGETLTITALTREAPDLERWSSVRRRKLLEDALGLEVVIKVEREGDALAPSATAR